MLGIMIKILYNVHNISKPKDSIVTFSYHIVLYHIILTVCVMNHIGLDFIVIGFYYWILFSLFNQGFCVPACS